MLTIQLTYFSTAEFDFSFLARKLRLLVSQSIPSGSFHKPLILLPKRENVYRQTENHSHRKLTNLITWTTALSNSLKLWAMLCGATQDGGVMMETSDKMWSIGEGNGKPLQYSCLENPMNSIKGKKIGYWKGNSPGWQVSNMLLEKSRAITPERIRDRTKAKTTPSCGCDGWWK